MALILSGDGSVGPLSSTEMGYLDGVTSAVQTQIDGKATGSAVWTAYTPTIGGGTWALGDGTVSARYAVVGTLLTFRGVITWGSTSVFSASNALTVTLPVTTNVTAGVMVHAHYNDAAVNRYLGFARATSATVISFGVPGTNGLIASLTSTVPFTWGSGDQVFFYGVGETG